MNQELNNKLVFNNDVINKKKLQRLMSLTFHNYGVIRSSLIADKVKNLTFHYATISGISLSVEDLRVPFRKRNLIGLTTNEVDLTEQNFTSGNITVVERFQKIIDIWNNANNTLKDEVLTYFRESDPLNSLYIMAFSGARGNISQVRQLVGMRGLMADPQGQIIDLPIKSNFREGLKVTEYIISSYGARKGLVDTALRTADSGYLTRRLVDVAQDIIIRDDDCLTQEGLSIEDLFTRYKTDLSLEDRLVGRLLVKPFSIEGENISFAANTEIDNEFIAKISKLDYKDLEVRSPLTCKSFRSVCRKCYGWHLSYSKIIDLGEAVGILAAQSIGEPGTQLTMRTFHTGGVFSGDLTKQIRAPFSGTLKYELKAQTSLVRTMHGEKGFNLMEDVTLRIENAVGNVCSLDIPRGALLLVNTNKKVYCNQVVAEIKKDANLILEEDRRDIYSDVSGEVFLQNVKLEESLDGEGATKKITKTDGLIWVLYGNRYVLQGSSKLDVSVGQKLQVNDTAASQNLINNHAGIVSLDNFKSHGEVQIINSSLVVENSIVSKTTNTFDTFQLITDNRSDSFSLTIKENETLTHGQTIASLIENSYITETGGILYYSLSTPGIEKKRNTKKIFTGSLYWVPEETFQLNAIAFSAISCNLGNLNFVSKDIELYPGVTPTISGFVELNEDTSELIIRPGELYKINSQSNLTKCNRFLRPGSLLLGQLAIQKLTYLEFLSYYGVDYILLRPVDTFTVPQEKGFYLNYKIFPNIKRRGLAIQTVKRFFYKNGEKIKSANGGVKLLQTFFVLDIKNNHPSLKAKLNYLPLSVDKNTIVDQYNLNLILYEQIKARENPTKDKIFLKCLVANKQYIKANTAVAKLEMLIPLEGKLVSINKTNNTELLLLNDIDIKKCFYDSSKEKLLVQKGDLVRVGTFLSTKTRSKFAGQIIDICNDKISIRLGLPYLVSGGAILRVGNNSLVERADMLATLVYEKLKTVDIVQGLPKVEEILEARKIKNGCLLAPTEGYVSLKQSKIEIQRSPDEKIIVDLEQNAKINFNNGKYVNFLEPLTDGPISPHDKLETLFNYYQQKFPVHEACKKSFKYLQLFLVNEVQRTYLSQGVQIADKHIEIIVKQMTCKVRVLHGGDTTLLPGEILDISQAETISLAALTANESPPLYKPLLLGLTKASLNSDSFISAASFQETTRVLTEAAIEGKKDWLNGLKENVIIGRLIPAGTGFNSFENIKRVKNDTLSNLLIKPTKKDTLKSYVLNSRLD